MSDTANEALTCPACGSTQVVPIAYGYPSAREWERARRGKVVLGGCVIGPDSARWACKACCHQFGNMEEILGQRHAATQREEGGH
jgi:hypothetical protein